MKIKKIFISLIAAVSIIMNTACSQTDNTADIAGIDGTDKSTEDSSITFYEETDAPLTQTKAANTTTSAISETPAAAETTTVSTTAEETSVVTEKTTSATTAPPVTTTSTATTAVETTSSAATTTEAAEVTTTVSVNSENSIIKSSLSNPNADKTTQKVYEYICENFGSRMLSCQQESTWMGTPDYEMNHIENVTGKLPAMRGLDYMNDDFEGVNRRAIEWWEKGGLVTICWHTGINGRGYQESLNDTPDFDKLLTEGTNEYNEMIESWDRAAKALQELRDKGVTVLWRPFHEFDGQWFWWGKGGSSNFIKLWQMMYDRFTNDFGLTNLIWVLGYSGEVKNGWYVGDDYCDIIGSDTYDNSTNSKAWKRLVKVANKPLAFHECGNIPQISQFGQEGCLWSWFMVWHTDYIMANDKDNLKEVYNNELVITLDELPSFR